MPDRERQWATDCWNKSGIAHFFVPTADGKGYVSICEQRGVGNEDLQKDYLRQCKKCRKLTAE